MSQKSSLIYRKLKISSDLFEFAIKIKTHQLKKKFPKATSDEIKAMVISLIERGCR